MLNDFLSKGLISHKPGELKKVDMEQRAKGARSWKKQEGKSLKKEKEKVKQQKDSY